MKNNGKFIVLRINEEKYAIVWVEKGERLYLNELDDKYIFDSYSVADDYIKNNKAELNKFIADYKEKLKKEAERKIEEENARKEEERIRSEEREKRKTERKEKRRNFWYSSKGLISVALVVALISGMLQYGIPGIVNLVKKNKGKNKPSAGQEIIVDESQDNALIKKFREFLVKEGIIYTEKMVTGKERVIPLIQELSEEEVKEIANEFFEDELFVELLETYGIDSEELNEESKIEFCDKNLREMGINTNEIDISNDIEEIKTASADYSTESFEELVEDFSEEYVENKVNVSTEDLTKFNVIMVVDNLCEENPELIQEIFGVSTKEEILSDAAKVIGVTYMYNSQIWEKEKSTDNFIWISDGIHENDPQREKMEEIEEYVKKIAVAASKSDADEVNKIFAKFYTDLTSPTGKLNALDDGTEVGARIWEALVNNSIGRNYLTKENRDYLDARSDSEANLSNIITQIDGCKTRVRTRGQ